MEKRHQLYWGQKERIQRAEKIRKKQEKTGS